MPHKPVRQPKEMPSYGNSLSYTQDAAHVYPEAGLLPAYRSPDYSPDEERDTEETHASPELDAVIAGLREAEKSQDGYSFQHSQLSDSSPSSLVEAETTDLYYIPPLEQNALERPYQLAQFEQCDDEDDRLYPYDSSSKQHIIPTSPLVYCVNREISPFLSLEQRPPGENAASHETARDPEPMQGLKPVEIELFWHLLQQSSNLWQVIELYEADVRVKAVDILGVLRRPVALDALIYALRDKHWEVRAAAAQGLGYLHDPIVVEALKEALEREKDDMIVRQALVRALGRQQDLRTRTLLKRILRKDSDSLVREAAAWALGQFGAQTMVYDLLYACRCDPDELVRASALEALQNIDQKGARIALPTLQKLYQTEADEDVINALQKTLLILEGLLSA